MRISKYTLAVLLVIAVVSLFSCSSSSSISTQGIPTTTTQTTVANNSVTTTISIPNVPTISSAEANNLLQQENNSAKFVIIDVRTADEFSTGHIANSLNIDYYSSEFKSQLAKLNKDNKYLIYCRTGIRGAFATQIMLDLGFKDVHNLSEGIVQWVQDAYPTVK